MTPFSFQEDSSLPSQASALEGRKKLMQALQQAALKGHYQNDATAPYELLGNLATMWIANQGQQGFVKEEAELARRTQADLAGSAQAYMDRRDGKAGEVMSDAQAEALMQGDQAPQLAEPVKADPKAALVQALASQHPELQKIGQLDAQMLMKTKQPNNLKVHTVDDKMYGVDDAGQVRELAHNPKDKDMWDQTTVNVDGKNIMVNRNKVTGEMKSIGSGGNNVTVNNGSGESLDLVMAKETAKKSGELAAKNITKFKEDAMGAASDMQTALRMSDIARSPDFISGPFANAQMTVLGVAQKLGLPGNAEGLAQTQEFLTSGAKTTLAASSFLKGPSSDKDIDFLKQAAAGQIEYTPEALRRLADLSVAANFNRMLDAQNSYTTLAQNPAFHGVAMAEPMGNISVKLPEDFDQRFEQLPGGYLRPKGPVVAAKGSPAAGKPVSGKSGASGSNIIIRKWGGS